MIAFSWRRTQIILNKYSVENAKYESLLNTKVIEADEQIVSFDVSELFASIQ